MRRGVRAVGLHKMGSFFDAGAIRLLMADFPYDRNYGTPSSLPAIGNPSQSFQMMPVITSECCCRGLSIPLAKSC